MENPEVARRVNERIREAAASFAAVEGDAPVEFVCECGCMTFVRMTLAEYQEQDGAWLPEHEEAAVEAHRRFADPS